MKEPVLALLRCGLIVFSPPVVREARDVIVLQA